MSAYERSQDVAADPGSVFAFLTDVENLPSYLPPIHEAHAEGEELDA